MSESQLQRYLTEWRQSEDKFYASVMNVPELYIEGIQLVRAIADQIPVEMVEGLPEAYESMSIQEVFTVAESMELPHQDFLDFHLAKGAGFYLRHRQILEEDAKKDMRGRIEAAKFKGSSWVILYHSEPEGHGTKYFQRLEMHLPDGCGIYSALELDWERGRLYVVEPLYLDPETGEPRREIPQPDPTQEFASRDELDQAVEKLKIKYSANDVEPIQDN